MRSSAAAASNISVEPLPIRCPPLRVTGRSLSTRRPTYRARKAATTTRTATTRLDPTDRAGAHPRAQEDRPGQGGDEPDQPPRAGHRSPDGQDGVPGHVHPMERARCPPRAAATSRAAPTRPGRPRRSRSPRGSGPPGHRRARPVRPPRPRPAAAPRPPGRPASGRWPGCARPGGRRRPGRAPTARPGAPPPPSSHGRVSARGRPSAAVRTAHGIARARSRRASRLQDPRRDARGERPSEVVAHRVGAHPRREEQPPRRAGPGDREPAQDRDDQERPGAVLRRDRRAPGALAPCVAAPASDAGAGGRRRRRTRGRRRRGARRWSARTSLSRTEARAVYSPAGIAPNLSAVIAALLRVRRRDEARAAQRRRHRAGRGGPSPSRNPRTCSSSRT